MKQKRYWLRGGIILVAVFTLLYLWNWMGYIFDGNLLSFSMGIDVLLLPYGILQISHNPSFYVLTGAGSDNLISLTGLASVYIFGSAMYSLFGTIIGSAYGFIRSKRKLKL